MESEKENFTEMDEIWVEIEKLPNPGDFPFLKANILNIDTSKNIAEIKHLNGIKERFNLSKITKYLRHENLNVDDMADIPSINAVDLLNNLKNRFELDQIFTNVGKAMIILNPYKIIPGIFTTDKMDSIIEEFKAKVRSTQNKTLIESPHVHQMTMNAIDELISNKRNQAMVISGESGAGKTETAKQVMKFITYFFAKEHSQKNPKGIFSEVVMDSLEEKILSCNPVLETFGNSKTLRNDNSSRFGKYIKIFVDLKKMNIIGAHIDTYLLEKSRVCKISKGERNYHIFYQLLKGINFLLEIDFDIHTAGITSNKKFTEIAKRLKNENLFEFMQDYFNKEFIIYYLGLGKLCSDDGMIDLSIFNYLRCDDSGCKTNKSDFDVKNINDTENFFETLESLIKTGFNYEQISRIMQIVMAILFLGNLEFVDNKANTSEPCKLSDNTKNYLDKAALLLNVAKEDLYKSVTFNKRVINNETIYTPLKMADCQTFRDSFAKEIYNRLFTFLVGKMNASLSMTDNPNYDEDSTTINKLSDDFLHFGILDIFGFECFNKNSFEQFCINYSNERLHQLYINEIFKQTEVLFQEENLSEFYSKINFQDNSPVIELMDKRPNGIFFLLDNECSLTAEDSGFLNKVNNTHKTNQLMKRSKTGPDSFIIVHTAKEVEYTSAGFVGKNLDEFKQSMTDCLNKISDEIIQDILLAENKPLNLRKNFHNSRHNSGGSTNKKEKFLGGKFRNDMNNLIEELRSSNCHYIRCLKPNDEKSGDLFIPNIVLQQIKYLGIMDTIKVRRQGYPVKFTFYNFYRRYQDAVEFNNKPFINDVKLYDKNLRDYSKKLFDCLNSQYFKIYKNNINGVKTTNSFDNYSQLLFGKTFVFIRQAYYEELEKLKKILILEKEKSIVRIVKNYKQKQYRMKFVKLRENVIKIQKRFRILQNQRFFKNLRKFVKKVKDLWTRFKMKKAIKIFNRKLNIIKNFISKLKFKATFKSFMKKLKIIKNSLLIFHKRLKYIINKRVKKIIQDILSETILIYFENLLLKSVKLIQRHSRSFISKQKLGDFYENVKIRLKELKISIAIRKIQNNFRISKIKKYVFKLRYLSDKIKGLFKIKYYQAYITVLRMQINRIQKNFRIFIYRKKILNERWDEFIELEDLIHTESKILNQMNLFPNHMSHLKDLNQQNPLRFKKLTKMYQKKLLNNQPDLYLKTSLLRLSPFDEPKLHFFAHILDIDTVIDTDEVYSKTWGETANEIIKYCITWNSPVQAIEIGSMHSLFINSQGKIFAWGWNGQGQCGFRTEKDLEFRRLSKDKINNNVEFNNNSNDNNRINELNNRENENEKSFHVKNYNYNLTEYNIDKNLFQDENNLEENQDSINNYNSNSNSNLPISSNFENRIHEEDIAYSQDSETKGFMNLEELLKQKTMPYLHIENADHSITSKKEKSNERNPDLNRDVDELIEDLSSQFKFQNLEDFYYLNNPVLIEIENFIGKKIIAGDNFSILISRDDKLSVFGANEYNQLGINYSFSINKENAASNQRNIYSPINLIELFKSYNKSNKFQLSHVEIKNLKIIDAKSAGNSNILLTDKGELILLSHQSTNYEIIKFPRQINFIRQDVIVSQVDCGRNFTILLSNTGIIYAFGDNNYGQLGLGDYETRTHPVEIKSLKDAGIKVSQISCGFKHVVIRASNYKVFTWGSNSYGQLGLGTIRLSSLPVTIHIPHPDLKINNIIYVSAGLRSTVLLTESRQIFHCGTSGDITNQKTPVIFDYINKVPEVFSYDNHQIVKIHHTWNNFMSVMYAVVAETGPLKTKLKNPTKMKSILNALTNKWVSKGIYAPVIEHVSTYVSSKHLENTGNVKSSSSSSRCNNNLNSHTTSTKFNKGKTVKK